MDTETLRIKIPTYKTVIEIDGQDLVLNFRQLKRNERMKKEIDAQKALELLRKDSRTEQEQTLVDNAFKDINNKALDLLESIEGNVSISGEVVTLEGLKKGDFPDWIYNAINAALRSLNEKLHNLKVEANSKNEDQHSGLPSV